MAWIGMEWEGRSGLGWPLRGVGVWSMDGHGFAFEGWDMI